MEHANTNHQLHGQRHRPQCVISVLRASAKSAQNQPIQWMLWGLKGMHPDMLVMSQACQSIVMHPQGKWSVPAAIISSMDRGTHHNASFLSCAFCQICPKPGHLMGTVWPERDASWHAGHVPTFSIQYHAPTRQMEHRSSNHSLHGQRHIPQCILSIQCVFSKSAQNQSICWVLWGLKGMPPDIKVTTQAC